MKYFVLCFGKQTCSSAQSNDLNMSFFLAVSIHNYNHFLRKTRTRKKENFICWRVRIESIFNCQFIQMQIQLHIFIALNHSHLNLIVFCCCLDVVFEGKARHSAVAVLLTNLYAEKTWAWEAKRISLCRHRHHTHRPLNVSACAPPRCAVSFLLRREK